MYRTPAITILALGLLTENSPAADVEWRRDYTSARAEATKSGRPLLLVFETDSCTFCRKLDATTLRDPKVVRALNDGFVPVKLDGHAERKLVEALKIEGYPTIIVASAAGKVVGRNNGFTDTGEMIALLGKASSGESAAAPRVKVEEAGDQSPGSRKTLQARIEADLDALHEKIAADLNRSK